MRASVLKTVLIMLSVQSSTGTKALVPHQGQGEASARIGLAKHSPLEPSHVADFMQGEEACLERWWCVGHTTE